MATHHRSHGFGRSLDRIKRPRTVEYRMMLLLLTFMVVAIPTTLFAKAILLRSAQGGTLVEIKFEAGEYGLTTVPVNGEQCTGVELKDASGAATTLTKGSPDLPFLAASVAIPGDAAMGFEIVSQTVKELRVNRIVPSKGSFSRSIDPATVPYAFGDSYSRDQWFPGQTVTLGEPYIINTVRGMVVTCCPFQYNAKSGILKVTTSIVVRVQRIGTSSINTLSTRNPTITPAFDGLYSRHFINFEAMRPLYTYVPDGDKMIIIAPTALKGAMQPLVDWKNQKGIATTLYEYPSQTGGSDTTALKTFIKNKYAGDGFSYVILVGDSDDLPSLLIPVQSLVVPKSNSDVAYMKLSGSDMYPDAFIGRFCSSKADDIAALANKTVQYEKFPDPNGDWYAKAVGVGSDEGSPKDKDFLEKYRTQYLEPYGYTTVDGIYDPDAPLTPLVNALNQGRSWMNYMGHGGQDVLTTTGFGNSHVSKLTNTNMPTVMVVVGCFTGWFGQTCLGEVTTCAAGKGALAYMGSYIGQAWVEPQWTMTEMIGELLTKDKCLSVGAIFYNGQCKMLDLGKGSKDAADTYYSWIYFGDPSVMHFSKKPKSLTVTAPASIGKGSQQVKVTLSDTVRGRIALYDSVNKRPLGSALMAASAASATVSATIPENIQSVTLTVTAFNRVTSINKVPVGNVGTSPDDPAAQTPLSLKLRQGRSGAYFAVSGPSTVRAELTIFDLLGHLVYEQSGNRIEPWRNTDSRGARIARGAYCAVVKLYDRGRVTRAQTFVMGIE